MRNWHRGFRRFFESLTNADSRYMVWVDGSVIAEFDDRRDAYQKAMELSRPGSSEFVCIKQGSRTVICLRGGLPVWGFS
jgi:hypothetical protein